MASLYISLHFNPWSFWTFILKWDFSSNGLHYPPVKLGFILLLVMGIIFLIGSIHVIWADVLKILHIVITDFILLVVPFSLFLWFYFPLPSAAFEVKQNCMSTCVVFCFSKDVESVPGMVNIAEVLFHSNMN